jgi:nucleotide-binding universal stress UspA family protein
MFREETNALSIDVSWSQTAGDVASGVSAKARYADLVILGQYEQQGSPERHPLPIAHSVVLQCGRPVLVVPPAARLTELARVAVAWDGSREAVRAVHDALPLLRRAQSVQAVTMRHRDSLDDEVDAKRLTVHLANHGIRVETDALQVRTIEEHKALRKRIEDGHYDLLVMGGYSHPLWQEFIFGGATKSILLSSNIPILVSH